MDVWSNQAKSNNQGSLEHVLKTHAEIWEYLVEGNKACGEGLLRGNREGAGEIAQQEHLLLLEREAGVLSQHVHGG